VKVSRKTWSAVFERDLGRCRYCGTDLLASVPAFCAATMDRVEGPAGAGTDDAAHLVRACAGCASMLGGLGHLKTFSERKTFLDQQHGKGRLWYLEFRSRLRKDES
jgi:hypothetical protein